MRFYISDIEKESLANSNFRQVLYTAPECQLVVMSLKPKEEIGEEVHTLDQFIRIESGMGKAVLEGEEFDLTDGFAMVIPKGVRHNIINTSDHDHMKLYTLYAPPAHRDGVVHRTKSEAEADEHDSPSA